jgi:hypothetical protein
MDPFLPKTRDLLLILGVSRYDCLSLCLSEFILKSSTSAIQSIIESIPLKDERKKRSSWILFLNQNFYQLIPIHSVKVSTAFSRPSTERCTMLIGIGKDLLVHVLEGSIHGNHHVFLPRAWYGFVLGVV